MLDSFLSLVSLSEWIQTLHLSSTAYCGQGWAAKLGANLAKEVYLATAHLC